MFPRLLVCAERCGCAGHCVTSAYGHGHSSDHHVPASPAPLAPALLGEGASLIVTCVLVEGSENWEEAGF